MMETRTRTRVSLPLALACLAVAGPLDAQWSATVHVTEPVGIRRTAFPTSARLVVPEGRIEYVSQVLLSSEGEDVLSQATAWSRWTDGSIREVEVDFNLSIGPFEERTLELRYGPDVTAGMPGGRGLAVTEDERSIEVGNIRINKGGSTLISSVAYREEAISPGRNGLSVVERSGIRRDPREIRWDPVEILKPGPLRFLARYSGTLTLSGGSVAEITLDMEVPNSKSWLKMSVTASDPDAKIGDLGFETPLSLGPFPWTWDFATPNGTYGAFRDQTGSVIFTRTVDEAGAHEWRVVTGAAGAERPYEQSRPSQEGEPPVWAHFVGPDEAVALAVERGTEPAGTLTIWLTGTGQTTVSFESAEPETEHRLTLYQHYVATPLPIGAATSPASILSPLEVRVE